MDVRISPQDLELFQSSSAQALQLLLATTQSFSSQTAPLHLSL